MQLATITISASDWLRPAGILLAAALLLLIWSYRRNPGASLAHRIAFGLKLLGILALALCLIEPLWSGRRATSGANVLVVAADNSLGMGIRDDGATQTRGEMLRALCRPAKTAGSRHWPGISRFASTSLTRGCIARRISPI